MNTKRKLLFSFAGLILSIAIFSTVVFAWFAISNATGEFVVETGNLETDTKLYHAKYIPATTDEGGNTVAAHYKYTLVDTVEDANNLFENMIPGQIITFQLEISNSNTSSIKANYEAKLGSLFFGNSDGLNSVYSGITFSEITATTVLTNTTDDNPNNDQHLFHAINMVVSKVAESKDFAEGADVIPVATIQGVKIVDSSTFKPVDAAQTLAEKVSDKSLASGGDLAAGKTDIYIIKFYFDPTYGKPNSNQFRLNAFKIGNITVNYTQKEQITE